MVSHCAKQGLCDKCWENGLTLWDQRTKLTLFPTDPVRHEIWSRIMRKQRGEPYFKYNKFATVCSLHFTADCFYTTKKGRSKIKETAIPSLMLYPVKSEKKKSPKESKNKPQPQEEDNLKDVDISDLQSVFDSPREVKLKRQLKKYEIRHFKQVKIIKRLRTEVNRLRKRNLLLHNTVKDLKKRGCMSPENETSNDTPELCYERIFFKEAIVECEYGKSPTEDLVECEYGKSPTEDMETPLTTFFTKFADNT